MAGNVISYKNIKRNAQKNKIANFTIWIWLPSSEMTKNRQKKNLALAICSIFLSFYPACAGPKGLRTSHFDFSIFSKLQVPWRPPRLVRSSSPSGYILPRSPPVAYWVVFFLFFSKCLLRNTLRTWNSYHEPWNGVSGLYAAISAWEP